MIYFTAFYIFIGLGGLDDGKESFYKGWASLYSGASKRLARRLPSVVSKWFFK